MLQCNEVAEFGWNGAAQTVPVEVQSLQGSEPAQFGRNRATQVVGNEVQPLQGPNAAERGRNRTNQLVVGEGEFLQGEVGQFGRNLAGQIVPREHQLAQGRKAAQFRRNYVTICNILYINMLQNIRLSMYHLRYAEMSEIKWDGIGVRRTILGPSTVGWPGTRGGQRTSFGSLRTTTLATSNSSNSMNAASPSGPKASGISVAPVP